MAFDSSYQIKTITNPTLVLEEMSHYDTDYGTGLVKTFAENDTTAKRTGDFFPLLQIGTVQFGKSNIINFRLSVGGSDGFLPTITVTLRDVVGDFLSRNYPLDGEVLSVYIKTNVKELKPIRNDYIIDGVTTGAMGNGGKGNVYTITGYLKVPRLFGEFSGAIKNSTSVEALQKIATDLKLGFATNETITDDKMTWINPFDSMAKWIQDITSASYKNDDSFFISFIDQYYILNFVNVNKLFTKSADFEITKFTNYLNSNYRGEIKDGQDQSNQISELFLTNYNRYAMKNNYVSDYGLNNQCGQINRINGYKRYLQFYDKNDKVYESQFVQPLNTKNTEDLFLLRGKPGENIWKTENKYKWMGIQQHRPDGSVHQNYAFAKIQNSRNLQEIYKMSLQCTLPAFNPSLVRFGRIPVLIVLQQDEMQLSANMEENQVKENVYTYPDDFLSGFYVASDYVYEYEESDFKLRQKCVLLKREWDLNVATKKSDILIEGLQKGLTKGDDGGFFNITTLK